jgi:hypothetical protein
MSRICSVRIDILRALVRQTLESFVVYVLDQLDERNIVGSVGNAQA